MRARKIARPDRSSPFRGLEFPQDLEGLREFFRGSGHGRIPSGFVFALSDCVAPYLYYWAVRVLSYHVVPCLSYCVERQLKGVGAGPEVPQHFLDFQIAVHDLLLIDAV